MAIHGLSLAESEEYILPEDPGHPEHVEYKKAVAAGNAPATPTVFKIGNLTKQDRTLLGDMTNAPTMQAGTLTMSNKRTHRSYETVQRGLRGWSNLLTPEGKPIPFKTESLPDGLGGFMAVVSDESMLALPTPVIHQLAEQIMARNGLTNAAVKNSEGASLLSAESDSPDGTAEAAQMPSELNEGVSEPQ